jgi:hypothetical protein
LSRRCPNRCAKPSLHCSLFLDFIVRLDYVWLDRPISIVGDYVRNLGAAVPEDSGWSQHFALGEHSEAGNRRIGYGFAVATT